MKRIIPIRLLYCDKIFAYERSYKEKGLSHKQIQKRRLKDQKPVLVNLEAQKDEPTSYHILNRAVFYVSRLISSQKERDFVKTNYNDIRRVFSIWVCMNMDENSMAYVHLSKDDLLGLSMERWA